MLASYGPRLARRALPQLNGRIYLDQLHAPVTVHRDRWGIPHLYAANRHDLLLAQGFVHAQDRFWQMELNRRAAQGRLSELFGALTLDTDRLSRTLGFSRLAQPTWDVLEPDAQADLVAYTKGINAWLTSAPALPLELSLIRHKPQPWHLHDTLSYGRLQMWALTHGALSELIQAQLLEQLGEQRAADLALRYPDDNPASLPHGIEANGLRLDGLLGPWSHPYLGKGTFDGSGRGSNGWVIGPERSASGHALLANDMHLPVGIPSLWYTNHLHSEDGFHVTGFSLPGLPHVLVGHNEAISWGATLAYTDCEDLFCERAHLDQPFTYDTATGWQPAQIHDEFIQVRGGKPHQERVIQTEHGPLINEVLLGTTEPIALCSMALRADVPIDGFRRLNLAQDWDGFVAAVARIQSPSLNLVYADRHDNIGYYVSGRVPVRAQGDGTLPVPGWTDSHDWVAEIPFTEMPHALNPAGGVIVTANHRITGDDYPHFLGNMWRNGYRAKRIEQLLAAQTAVSVADCKRIHRDVTTIPGQALRDWFAGFTTTDPKAQQALDLLLGWDGRLNIDSVGGAVYEVVVRRLSETLLEPHMDEKRRFQAMGLGEDPLMHPVNEFQGQWLVSLLSILEESAPRWLPQPQQMISDSLAQTTAELRQRLGPDPAEWQWGRLHRITFTHALGVVPVFKQLLNRGPFAIGGDENTVAQTSIRPDLPYDNNAISISSRLIVDMNRLNEAEAVHPPGQSGHLASPHYDDLIPLWLDGRYYRLLWDADDVRAGSQTELRLQPALSP